MHINTKKGKLAKECSTIRAPMGEDSFVSDDKLNVQMKKKTAHKPAQIQSQTHATTHANYVMTCFFARSLITQILATVTLCDSFKNPPYEFCICQGNSYKCMLYAIR